MFEKKFITILVVLTIVLFSGGVILLSQTSSAPAQITESENAKAFAESFNFDWGKIDYNGGYAKKTFIIKNTGTDTLKLSKITTSCTCTKAQVEVNGGKSPNFSMHSQSSWVGEVAPGSEAKLNIVFDPKFHGPSGVGPMSRIITVQTNDKQNPKLEFQLTGDVVK